jgi:hypothetical protein
MTGLLNASMGPPIMEYIHDTITPFRAISPATSCERHQARLAEHDTVIRNNVSDTAVTTWWHKSAQGVLAQRAYELREAARLAQLHSDIRAVRRLPGAQVGTVTRPIIPYVTGKNE